MARIFTIKHLIYFIGYLLLFLLGMALASCGVGESSLLSEVKLDSNSLILDGQGVPRPVNLNYTVGKAAQVSLSLEGPNNTRYELRQNEERPPGQYSTAFSGLVEVQEAGLTQRRLLPNGSYRYILNAVSGGEKSTEQGQFNVSGNTSEGAPGVTDLSAYPPVISPNYDAIDDVAILSWTTNRPATVAISVSGPNGFSKTLKTLKNQPTQADKTTFDGRDLLGDPLPDGMYNYSVQALDSFGQETRRNGQIEIKGGGKPRVAVTSAEIGPTEIIAGNEVTIKVRVKNIGKVPVRSKGPDSGYSYSTRDVYSSILGGKYDEEAGYWRIGVDFEANNSAGAVRYPWRWGFGKEFLQPGEEVEITGKIKIDRTEEKIVLYIGLIQEKISLQLDRYKTTQIKITY